MNTSILTGFLMLGAVVVGCLISMWITAIKHLAYPGGIDALLIVVLATMGVIGTALMVLGLF